ncbi:MAG TPA: response regulator [Geomonas sp.]|nr:response regulator [Geomonas sp.]
MATTILLVDDVSMFLELEKGFLQRSSVKILTARDGQQALELCRTERPALVFMDLHMPVMDGAACCRAIKKEPQIHSTPVVLITSEGKEGDREICLAAGCDGFLTKPLDRHLFLETARQLLPTIDRRDTRIPCHIKAKYRAFGVTLSGIVRDVSQNGVYLASETDLREGTELDVIFALPDPVGSIVQTRGKVAWLNTKGHRRKPSLPEGFGIEFLSLPEEAAGSLDRFLQISAGATSPAWRVS